MAVPRIFVANRGEIACRVIEACDRLGFESVLGASQADTTSLAARRAGRTVCLGAAPAAASYLDVKAVVHAAIATGCTALHPGYGFLSERAELARLCTAHGIAFVGPTPEQLETLGDKLSARRLAESAGVPVSVGGATASAGEALTLGRRIGYPVLVKAAYGGGGRGMKLVEREADLAAAWELASSEAAAAFGDGTVFVERFVRDAKHVEVQVIGDRHGTRLHLLERECTVQHRYQKVLEEAPCAALPDAARARLHAGAVRIADALGYVGLGTVEFLYDVQRDELCFLEVNPRVQVEHPVTEAITGIDVVREQLLIALGERLAIRQSDVRADGHAIEVRLTAQDPAHGLRPAPGRVTRWRPPALGGVRWDTHLYEGYLFPPYYDALMAKVIAFGADRAQALSRLRSALARLEVEGPVTNLPLLRRLLDHPDVIANRVTTRWLEQHLAPTGELS
jgi:acetyl-CoA carboxylase, biotin carboxylase subunit